MKVDIEKVLKGLAHCYGTETGSPMRNCDDCPYDNGYEDELRCGALERDAYIAIKELRSENNRLKAYDEQRDIALHARLIAETRADTAEKIFKAIIDALKYTSFASPLEKKSTLDYIYSLKKKYEGRKCNNDR